MQSATFTRNGDVWTCTISGTGTAKVLIDNMPGFMVALGLASQGYVETQILGLADGASITVQVTATPAASSYFTTTL